MPLSDLAIAHVDARGLPPASRASWMGHRELYTEVSSCTLKRPRGSVQTRVGSQLAERARS